ncbi:MAG: hypothetical protein ACFFE5_15125 [Candidatus Thorarchaeota archaeon]
MIIDIVIVGISFTVSLIGIVFLYLNRENFGSILNIILNGLIYIFLGILFFTFFFLSSEVNFTEEQAFVLWYFSILFWIISLSMLSIIQKFVINYEKKAILSMLLYSLFIGIILGLAIIPNSFTISQTYGFYFFDFQNLMLLFAIISYNLVTMGVLCYNLIKFYSNIRDNKSKKMLSALTIEFCVIIIFYSIFIITKNYSIKYIYAAFYIFGAVFVSYYLFRRPFMFIELTNKIYDFIIFHRSGILLYSYNFETGKETDESLLKGTILIGINHILSHFINKKDQLGLIKMQNRDIILEYDNKHGYALLLTTNHKNAFINKAVNKFMKKFTDLNQEKLKNLTGLIDASEFRNAKDIILEFFEPFIVTS